MSVPSPDAILHLATLHLLSQAGFASTSQAASLSLTSVVAQYLKLIARASIDRASLVGRSKPGTLDVVESLKGLGYGFGLDELYEYSLDHGGNILEGDGLDVLSDYLDEGRNLDEPLAELKLVPREEVEESLSSDEDGNSEGHGTESLDVKDEPMDVDNKLEDVKPDIRELPIRRMRFQSPDYSWLPPRPDASGALDDTSRQILGPDNQADVSQRDDGIAQPVTAPSSIADRYRTRIPFSSSSLSSQAIYTSPPPPSTRRSIAAAPSSLPHLIQTYNDTRNEMSVAIRPNGFRLQALDLLRRQIAAPDGYGPNDSLAAPNVVPGPKVSPISVPAHPVSINPSQQGILSQLVHSIHSANLPPELRERLTSLRPPLAQKRDGQSLTYGPGMRGADQAALLKNQGKQSEEKDEQYAYATWDSGPRGQEKFSRGILPRGKKVLKYVEGEEFPRQSEKRKSVDAGGESAPKTTLRLKLGDSVSPAPPSAMPRDGHTPTATPEPPLATPGGTTIKLRFPGSTSQEPRTVSPAPIPAQDTEDEVSETASEALPSLRISIRSPIPPSTEGGPDIKESPLPPARDAPAGNADKIRRVASEDVVDRKPSPTSLDAVPDMHAETLVSTDASDSQSLVPSEEAASGSTDGQVE